MHNILSDIIKKKRSSLQNKKEVIPVDKLRHKAQKINPDRRLRNSLIKQSSADISLIAEIKLVSPTISTLLCEKEIQDKAIEFENAGADALSVISEEHYFKGEQSFILEVKKKVNLPVLQKDFVVDPYQVYEAKTIGSDGMLFIARIVDKKTLQSLVNLSFDIKIEPVVEINNEADLKKAVSTRTKIIAVNARDLKTFEVNVDKACSLLRKIPNKYIKLGFSGIVSSLEIEKYKKAGVNGVLIGTSLIREKNAKKFIDSLNIL